jgi:stage V sporulation protein AF
VETTGHENAPQPGEAKLPPVEPEREDPASGSAKANPQGSAGRGTGLGGGADARPEAKKAREAKVPDDDEIPADWDAWMKGLKERIGLGRNFDVQIREMTVGRKRTALLFLSSLAKDAALTEVLKRLTYLDAGDVGRDALQAYFEQYVPAIQVRKSRSFGEMIGEVLAGGAALFVDGERGALLIDAKQYPTRTPDEPVLEKVVRGSKDGLVETLLTNVALIRRRLRDPKLRFEIMKVGGRTQTDVAIGYIEDIADPELVEAVRDKIKAVRIDGLPLADKQLEEMTVNTGWNPFPRVRYSERPDVVAAQLLDGNVTVIVDTSPSAILLPTTFFDLVQHAEENRQSPFIGTYLRWVRFFGIWSSLFLLPLWYLLTTQPALRPDWLWVVGAHQNGRLPLIVQFLLAEIGVDLIRLAAVHTPAPLVAAMSLIAALMVGDIAVKTGLFVNEVVLYMAVAAVGMFATPSYELGLANRIVRLALLLAAFLFQVPGFVVCLTAVVIGLALARSFNTPYLWPLIPFNPKAIGSILLRRPLPSNVHRPSLVRAQDDTKQPT